MKGDSNYPDKSGHRLRLQTDKIFEVISPEQRQDLMDNSVTHAYKAGEIIFREGGIPSGIFHIKKGIVKKYKTVSTGDEIIIYICGMGDLLGYHTLLSDGYYPHSTATLCECEITFIRKENFLQVLQSSIPLYHTLLKALGNEFSLFITDITFLSSKPARERLAIALLMLDEKFRTQYSSGNILLPRTDLANIVGTAKETLVRMLQEFVADGLIEKTDKAIRIVDRVKLTELVKD